MDLGDELDIFRHKTKNRRDRENIGRSNYVGYYYILVQSEDKESKYKQDY